MGKKIKARVEVDGVGRIARRRTGRLPSRRVHEARIGRTGILNREPVQARKAVDEHLRRAHLSGYEGEPSLGFARH